MGARVRAFQVDAFTTQRFCGNPAGVVLDAEHLSEQDMRALARELNTGDCAFVLPADAPDHDLRVRFFTPRSEAAFVGHATLATHAVFAALQLPPRRRQRQKSGIVEVDTLGVNPPRIAIRQPPPPPARALGEAELQLVLEALGLDRADLDPRCPSAIAGQSSSRVLLGVTQASVLACARPDNARLTALSARIGAPGYFLFTLRPAQAGVLTESRMFCPALGIEEDPVSGNAHALLGAYLLQHELIDLSAQAAADASGSIEFTGAQGHYVDRPGRVGVELALEQRELRCVSIIGEAVIVFQTSLEF